MDDRRESTAADGERQPVLLSPSGPLVEDTCGDLRCQLAAAFAAGVTQVVLDLAEVTALDTTGLGVLAGASRHLAGRGGALVVHRAHPALVTMLRVNGLGHLLEVAPAQELPPLRLVPTTAPVPERRLSVVRGVSGT